MQGFKSPLFFLGIGTTTLEIAEGRGAGPLPFTIGTTTLEVTWGRGAGPLPFTIGNGEAIEPPEPIEPPAREAYSSMVYGVRPDHKREDFERLIEDDKELVEIMIILAESGVLD